MFNQNFALSLSVATLIMSSLSILQGQDNGQHFEIGVVYYAAEHGFSALEKDTAAEGGSLNYSAKVKGAHAAIRLPVDQPKIFQVCGVDATRFKLYKFRSAGNARILTIVKRGLLSAKTVMSDSEVPVGIKSADSGCYTLTPKKNLEEGEFGFSPFESADAFMFGVGDLKQHPR